MTSKKLTPHKRRQAVISRLVEVPKTQKKFFWAREMKMLKTLEERYSLEFLEVMTFPRKYDSLAYFVSQELRSTLQRKWNNFNYKTDSSKYDEILLGEKTGKDYIPEDNKPKNTKDFLS